LTSNGIFIFQKQGKTEIITLSDKQLHNLNDLGLGTSLLGQYKRNNQVNLKNTLTASNGNMDIMKAVLFVSENPELFYNTKIDSIKALNIWQGTQVDSYNSQIISNFKDLITYSKLNYNLNENLFNSDVDSLMNLADS